ncbi:MAG: acetylglutamate kinase [Saprospiraceae bacterium]|nr:acetylglutamate kinase [Saprospiraceae bacterium]HRK81606.1 acetylglutamate kinase [Saprospiraceae bacterium]
MTTLHIIKIGGNIIDDPAALDAFLRDFAAVEGPKILLHGGGKKATALSERLGIPTHKHQGRRITDAATLEVAVMVYAGWINKSIVAALSALQCPALGLCGADADFITAVKRPVKEIDFGFVGDVVSEKTRGDFLQQLLQQGLTPVVAPITHDGAGQLLNTNADTMAFAVAVAMAARFEVQLIYCFEKKGVLTNVTDDNSVLPHIAWSEYEVLKTAGIVSEGMIPKLDNAFAAIREGVRSVVIGHAGELKEIVAGRAGTRLGGLQ